MLESSQLNFPSRNKRNSVFHFYIVLCESPLPAESTRMIGPVFKSVLNTPMSMNSPEEKGYRGQLMTEKVHIYLVCGSHQLAKGFEILTQTK